MAEAAAEAKAGGPLPEKLREKVRSHADRPFVRP
ncbi:putative membrane protein [Streptomyces sp. TE33382]